MCTRRHVCYIYTRCGHGWSMPEQIIPCNNPRCRFSPAHPAHCPNCSQTCWQYRQPSEQYSPQIPEYCPNCTQA